MGWGEERFLSFVSIILLKIVKLYVFCREVLKENGSLEGFILNKNNNVVVFILGKRKVF